MYLFYLCTSDFVKSMAIGMKKIEKRNPEISKIIKESKRVIYPDWYSITVITLLLQNGQTHFCGSTPKTISFLFLLKILIFSFIFFSSALKSWLKQNLKIK